MAVKQYQLNSSLVFPRLVETVDGPWVKHADYAALEGISQQMAEALKATRQLNMHLNEPDTIGARVKSEIDAALAAYTALTKGADHAADTGADKQRS